LNFANYQLVYLSPKSLSTTILYQSTVPSCKPEQLISRRCPSNLDSWPEHMQLLQTSDSPLSISHKLQLLFQTYCRPIAIMPTCINVTLQSKDYSVILFVVTVYVLIVWDYS